jgi:hypothetical protein
LADGVVAVTLRDRCKELVREWLEVAEDENYCLWDVGYSRAKSSDAGALQAAMEATEGEALDAARYRWLRDAAKTTDFDLPRWTVAREESGWGNTYRGDALDAAIDAAMKESKP